tara:strand:+ start:563 stop:1213 length:651 start_codon:yes stop_codon:yes gene_type:complete
MALNKLKYNSLNLTPAANKAISFDSDADALEATLGAGSMVFIKKLTASSSGTLSFVDGSSDVVLDSTYKEYIFICNNIHASAQSTFSFNFRDGSTDYDATKTTTHFYGYHNEAGNSNGLSYTTGSDLAQGTGFQVIADDLTVDNDHNLNGILHLFNPSSTTFVKHFLGTMQFNSATQSTNSFVAGYCNTTTAIDAVQFKMTSGNMDTGTITLYGIN